MRRPYETNTSIACLILVFVCLPSLHVHVASYLHSLTLRPLAALGPGRRHHCHHIHVGLSSTASEINDTQDDNRPYPYVARRGRRKSRDKNGVKWIACTSTAEVTRAIKKYVRSGGVVAELGSQLRVTSSTLCEAIGPTGRAVLVDIERNFPNESKGEGRTSAMRRKGDEHDFYRDRAEFIETRGFEFWRDALFFRELPRRSKYDVLVVDVSTAAGNDLELACISLMKEFLALNRGPEGEGENQSCGVVIVKSGSLQNLARRLHHAQSIISGAHQLPHERSTDGRASIVAAVGVKQYRDTIPFVVRRGDVCVEVGCHLGTTTKLIDEAATGGNDQNDDSALRCGGCLGVDVGPSIVKSAKKKYPHLAFEVSDGFKTAALARMRDKHFSNNVRNGNCDSCSSRILSATYDVVYIDVGGLSGSEGLLEAVSLLAGVDYALEPRCVVIKSLCIRRLASLLVPFSEVWRKERTQEPINQ